MMGDCTFKFRLVAHYDRELDAGASRRVEAHVAHCPACRAELEAMRELSVRVAAASTGAADVDAIVARMHRAVDRAADQDHASLPLLRTAGLLAALAASVLIVSGIWMLDTRRDPRRADASARPAHEPAAISPDWERVAMTLHAAPRPGIAGDSVLTPRYAASIDWMLNSLRPINGPNQGKPCAEPNSF